METLNFKQRAKVGVSGNLINQLMGNNSTIPVVGKGATQLHYSDRSCFEVIEVSEDFKTVKLEYLDAVADKSKGELVMGHQEWILNPTGQFKTIVWRNNQWKVRYTEIVFTKEFLAKYEGEYSLYRKLTVEQYEFIYGDDCRPNKVWEGITEEKVKYSPISLIFGCKDYRYDWEF